MSNERARRLRTLLDAGGAFPIEGKALIRVGGADHIRYLNGQLTSDVLRLSPDLAKSTLLLTVKGKLCAPLWIWKEAASMVIEVDECLLQATLDRLERYIISDDVTLTQVPSPSPAFHVFGTGRSPDGSRIISRLGVEGYDSGSLPDGLLQAAPEEREFLRIRRGIPRWGFELDATTLPQEARLESDSVDFDKGCYVGQEVVSRLKSVGRVNRLLQAFVGILAPVTSDRLFLHLPEQAGKVAGAVTSRCDDLELAQTIALGYLNREFEAFNSFVVADADGNALGKFEKRPILTSK